MKKSLFAQYCEERLDKTVLENEHGFVSIIMNSVFYIEDIFIKEESRDKDHAKKFFFDCLKLAKEKNYREVYGSVLRTAKNPEKMISMMISHDFKLSHVVGDMIYFKRGI